MRIISGDAKGKKILNPINKKTRPLKDMVRESIFNILNHSNLLSVELKECLVLDLFSGVGSFGLEAISRQAKKVIFYALVKICSGSYNLPTRFCPLTSEMFLKKYKLTQYCTQHKSAFDRFKVKQ